jgi:hypothetical protein
VHAGFGGGDLRRKRLLGSPRLKWEYTNKVDLQEAGWGGMDWLAQLRKGTGGWRL